MVTQVPLIHNRLKKIKYRVILVGGPDIDARIELMQYLRSPYEVIAVGSSRGLEDKFRSEHFAYYHYILARGVNPLTDILSIFQLFQIFRKKQPDIVHAFDTKPCVFARFAARMAGVPAVVGTLPGLGSLYTNDRIGVRAVRMIYQNLQSLSCKLSDLTVFQNQNDLREFVGRNLVSARKAEIIPGSGIQVNKFDREAVRKTEIEKLKRELGIQECCLVVTMISRLIRSKGILEFAEAAKIVKNRYKNVHFLLVGPNDQYSVDRLNAYELKKVTQSVNWLGQRQDIKAILALTDIFALPTFYREGIPRVLIEAASMGLPLITTRSPGCVEVVREGENGFLIPVRNSGALSKVIEVLIKQPALRAEFGSASRKLAVTQFDLSVIAKQTIGVYREVLDRKKRLSI